LPKIIFLYSGIDKASSLENEPSGYRPSDMLNFSKKYPLLRDTCSQRHIQMSGEIRIDVLEGCKYLLPEHRCGFDAGFVASSKKR